jgi:hypothetical protein
VTETPPPQFINIEPNPEEYGNVARRFASAVVDDARDERRHDTGALLTSLVRLVAYLARTQPEADVVQLVADIAKDAERPQSLASRRAAAVENEAERFTATTATKGPQAAMEELLEGRNPAPQPWFTVILRSHGDDEDSIYRGQHATVKEAISEATEWVKREETHEEDVVYVNYVLTSSEKPRLVQNNCGFGGID